MRAIILLATVLIWLVGSEAYGQGLRKQLPSEPKASLQTLMAKRSSVIVKGSSKIGSIVGRYGSKISIMAMESADSPTGTKKLGIRIIVRGVGKYETEAGSYIDFHEIDALIEGIDLLKKKAKGGITKPSGFESTYRTSSGLTVTVFNTKEGNMIAISSGRIKKTTAYGTWSNLEDFRNLIVEARQRLIELKKE